MKKNQILVIGRVGIDLYAQEEKKSLKQVTSFTRHVGGSAGNIAVALSRLGHGVKLETKIANDAWGKFIVDYLTKNKVKLDKRLVSPPVRNSLAITEIKEDSQVIFYRHLPSDIMLSPEEVNEKEVSKSHALILTGTAISCSPSRESVFLYLHYARRHNKLVFLDLDYRPTGWKNLYEILVYYTLVMEKTDILIGTLDEFTQVLLFFKKKKKPEKKQEKKISELEIAESFLTNQTRLVVIKKGKHGSIAYQRDEAGRLNSTSGGIFKVKLVKNFGAGDAFAGSFCSHWMSTKDLQESLKRGAAAAALVVSARTCTEAMPTTEEVNSFITQNRYHL